MENNNTPPPPPAIWLTLCQTHFITRTPITLTVKSALGESEERVMIDLRFSHFILQLFYRFGAESEHIAARSPSQVDSERGWTFTSGHRGLDWKVGARTGGNQYLAPLTSIPPTHSSDLVFRLQTFRALCSSRESIFLNSHKASSIKAWVHTCSPCWVVPGSR